MIKRNSIISNDSFYNNNKANEKLKNKFQFKTLNKPVFLNDDEISENNEFLTNSRISNFNKNLNEKKEEDSKQNFFSNKINNLLNKRNLIEKNEKKNKEENKFLDRIKRLKEKLNNNSETSSVNNYMENNSFLNNNIIKEKKISIIKKTKEKQSKIEKEFNIADMRKIKILFENASSKDISLISGVYLDELLDFTSSIMKKIKLSNQYN